MTRAVVTVVVGVAVALSACSGSGTPAKLVEASSTCPLLAALAQTGRTVATADVSDPVAFESTLDTAVSAYVRTARRLRSTVPVRLRADVDRMIAAAQQRRFADATSARNDIDDYAHSNCKVN